MIIDSHAHVSEKTWASPKFLEEVIEPAVRASGAPVPATVYEGTDIPGMMEAYRAAGVSKVMLYAVAPREARLYGRDPATREISGAHVSNDYIAEVHSAVPRSDAPRHGRQSPLRGRHHPGRDGTLRQRVRRTGGQALPDLQPLQPRRSGAVLADLREGARARYPGHRPPVVDDARRRADAVPAPGPARRRRARLSRARPDLLPLRRAVDRGGDVPSSASTRTCMSTRATGRRSRSRRSCCDTSCVARGSAAPTTASCGARTSPSRRPARASSCFARRCRRWRPSSVSIRYPPHRSRPHAGRQRGADLRSPSARPAPRA